MMRIGGGRVSGGGRRGWGNEEGFIERCLDRKKIAALVGVAPYNCDSGAMRGKRRVWGGRGSVRHALYMATLAARRFNSIIRTFFDRLMASGKEFKVAMTACMRKLLTILNAMLAHHTRWNPNVMTQFQPIVS